MDEIRYSIEGPDSELLFAALDAARAEAKHWRLMYEREHGYNEQSRASWEWHMERCELALRPLSEDDELLQAAKELGIDLVPPPLCTFE